MNHTEWYVGEVLRGLEHERRARPWSNERWLMELAGEPRPRSAFVAWLGERLVHMGERMRAWSAAEAAPMHTRRALQD